MQSGEASLGDGRSLLSGKERRVPLSLSLSPSLSPSIDNHIGLIGVLRQISFVASPLELFQNTNHSFSLSLSLSLSFSLSQQRLVPCTTFPVCWLYMHLTLSDVVAPQGLVNSLDSAWALSCACLLHSLARLKTTPRGVVSSPVARL